MLPAVFLFFSDAEFQRIWLNPRLLYIF